MSRFSLPPAVYKIHIGTGNDALYITDPVADNETLTLRGAITTDSAVPSTADQLVRCMMSSATIKFISDGSRIIQWLISGDGIVRSLAHDKKFASARLAPKTSDIIRSGSSLKWIIAIEFVYTRVYRYMPHSSISIATKAKALSEQMMAQSASGTQALTLVVK